MRKIVGFRLDVRPREILRRAKKAGLGKESPLISDAEAETLVSSAMKSARPSVVFDTFQAADPHSQLLSSMPGLAYSLVLTSLGQGFCEFRERCERENPAQASYWPIIEETALEESLRFASSLIAEEAGKESCDLSPMTLLREPSALEESFKKLQGEKIGVSFAEGTLRPQASSAASLAWLVRAKAKGRSR